MTIVARGAEFVEVEQAETRDDRTQEPGRIACRRGYSVLAVRREQMLKALERARHDNSDETELRKLFAVDLLLVDDFALDGESHRSRLAPQLARTIT